MIFPLKMASFCEVECRKEKSEYQGGGELDLYKPLFYTYSQRNLLPSISLKRSVKRDQKEKNEWRNIISFAILIFHGQTSLYP